MKPDNNSHDPSENRILAVLCPEEFERLAPHLEEVTLPLGDIISRPDEKIEYVYFPHRAIISVVALMKDGDEVEIGVVGNEGMFGLPLVLGTNSAPLQAVVQIAGDATRIKASVFNEEMNHCGQFHKLLLEYAQAFFIQTAQTAACNRLHRLDGRLARWLLRCQDQTRSNELRLTHEFIAVMLGVRRAGVSEAAHRLQADKLINYARGSIRILDRQGLEATSCECYGIIKREFDRLSVNKVYAPVAA
jgi:CRP-like cAMP-binding protein